MPWHMMGVQLVCVKFVKSKEKKQKTNKKGLKYMLTFFYILAATTALCVIISAIRATRSETAEQKKFYKWSAVILAILSALIIFVVIPTEKSMTRTSYSSNSSTKKCAMCGKMVSKDDMRGTWCKNCQNAAFGEDGCFHKYFMLEYFR